MSSMDTKPIPTCRFSQEYWVLNVENVLASVAYGLCTAFAAHILRLSLFRYRSSPFSEGNHHHCLFRRQIVLSLYAFVLIALASTFYLPHIISRLSASGSWRLVYDPINDGGRLWRGPQPFTKIVFGINDVLASSILMHLIFFTWRGSPFIIGGTAVLFFMRLIGTPLLFETVALTLSILRIIHVKTRPSEPDSFLPDSDKPRCESFPDMRPSPDTESYPSPLLVFIVNFIATGFTYTDSLLRINGIVDKEPVQFIETLMFFGSFLVQIIVLTYWAEGGPMCVKKARSIVLYDELSDDSADGSTPIVPSNNGNWEQIAGPSNNN